MQNTGDCVHTPKKFQSKVQDTSLNLTKYPDLTKTHQLIFTLLEQKLRLLNAHFLWVNAMEANLTL